MPKASREERIKKLGKNYVAPKDVKVENGEDRLDKIVKAQRAAKKANAGKVIAAAGLPATWTPKSA